ncbi:hypothetical protein AKJ37_02825 [candidate division MSBL1 archaeon SCGC-AAA259I09]|uniref:DUF401 family protein n=3 Tax=candidate division MSBL1 TaxID=215777 RepID=A0A133UTK3_9EURY|nr:hypothetical protein AKJ37_02825 [candidate division MSBL1 archaeon SCGC-AAA259I09]KXB00763.1 hypothetical protein AKJ40_00635 [candidate division MSBL1 archaeon SCGC-AAA259M10]
MTHELLAWIGFFITIAILIVGSKIHLGLSFISGGVILGLFTLSPSETFIQIHRTLTNPADIIFTVALTLIPIIAGVLQETGGIDRIVENLKLGKKSFLGISPALIGLLPIPGGALFSAPLIDKAGGTTEGHVKTGINVWFRHLLYFIYPLSPFLIIPAKIANLSVYQVIKYQIPFLVIAIGIGYIFLLRKTSGEINFSSEASFRKLMPPLSVILIAPILDFILQKIFQFKIGEISMLIAISSSLMLALLINGSLKNVIKKSIKKTKPWNFSLLILGVLIFLNIFETSNMKNLIAALSLSKATLTIGFGFLLGVATGRIDLPATIVFPIFLTAYKLNSIPPIIFSITYFAIFIGYVITPIHPCVGLTLEYFNAEINKFLKLMIPPTLLSLAVAIATWSILI